MVALLNSRISVIISLLAIISLFTIPSYSQYGGGTGKSEDPYLIYTAEHLNAIGAEPNDWDKHFKLMTSIDLSNYTETDFNIIGYWRGYFDNRPFTGVFDGNNNAISNLIYTTDNQYYVGFFSCLGINGKINNLNLEDVNVSSEEHTIGGLVGWNIFGTISNCYVSGEVSGSRNVGGLVGRNCGLVDNCHSDINVTGEDEIGGLVGWNDFGTIIKCIATGEIKGDNRVGGLVGPNWGEIADCYTYVLVTRFFTTKMKTIGGLVGENEFNGTITRCYSTGFIDGGDSSIEVGGLAGENSNTITYCDSNCVVFGGSRVGGLVGFNDGDGVVMNCYSTGTLIENTINEIHGYEYVGGLVGYNDGDVSNCYTTNYVKGYVYEGAEVGYNESDGSVLDSFWNTDTTDANGVGYNDGGVIRIFGKTTAEMQMARTFLDSGWDFVDETAYGTEDIWWIDEGHDYPRFWWELITKN